MRTLLVFVLLVTGPVPARGAVLNQRRVTLRRDTTLSVRIAPGLGTRFIFPFVLDRPGGRVPFTLDLTNPAVFAAQRDPGRNFFIVTARPGNASRRAYGILYVAVNGYTLSIGLRTTAVRAKDDSDVIFLPDPREKKRRLQRALARRTRVIETRCRTAMARQRAGMAAAILARISVLALNRPRRRAIEQEVRVHLPGGRSVALYVPESLRFGPYVAIVFRLRNGSAAHSLQVEGAQLFELVHGRAQPLSAAASLPRRIAAGAQARGVLTVTRMQLDAHRRLRLTVLTNRGTLETQW